jgi:hypothetical protein
MLFYILKQQSVKCRDTVIGRSDFSLAFYRLTAYDYLCLLNCYNVDSFHIDLHGTFFGMLTVNLKNLCL